MPTSLPMRADIPALATSDVQMALKVAHRQNSAIPDPGTIDNLWGSSTQASYLAWARTVGPAILGDAPNGLLVPMEARDTVALLTPGAYSVLYSFAQIYRAQSGATPPPANIPAPHPVAPVPVPIPTPRSQPGLVLGPSGSSSTTTAIVVLGVAIVGAGLFAWAISKGKKRRRR